MNLEYVVFVDIETVSQYRYHADLPERWKKLWKHKAQSIIKQDASQTEERAYSQAALDPAYGKIICISVGLIEKQASGKYKVRTKSFSGDNEKQLLMEAAAMLHRCNPNKFELCAHNSNFDFPYIRKRMVANRMKLPDILDVRRKKPWDLAHIDDTMVIWQQGDNRSYASLELLAAIFDIESSKDDIDGSQVGRVYWEENDLDRIVTYCEKDVEVLAKVYCAMTRQDEIEFEEAEAE